MNEEVERVDKTTIHESQLAIEAANRDIKLFEQYKRLTENDDFVDVIIKGYMQDHATALFDELMDGTQSTTEVMEKKMRRIEAIGEITKYVSGLYEKAQMGAERITREKAFIAKNGDL